jgi:hypothetical protein
MLLYRQTASHPSVRDVVRCYYELRGTRPGVAVAEGTLVPDGAVPSRPLSQRQPTLGSRNHSFCRVTVTPSVAS